MKYTKKIVSVAISALLAVSLAACDNTKNTSKNGATNKVTWWIENNISNEVKSYDEVNVIKEIEKKYDIDFEFFHPSNEQSTEKFNIMAASGDFKDIVTFNWNAYTGGPAKATKEGMIIALDEYIEKDMPNLSKIMKEDKDISYLAKNYDGTISVVPTFNDNIITGAVFGPQIRKDWLDKLGLEVPKTLDDWYNVLKAFKTKDPNGNGKADEIPFICDGSATFTRFSRAYNGVSDDFYLDEKGKIEFGFCNPLFKEFLIEMIKWYDEGLIDREYAANNSSIIDTKIASSIGGSYIGYSGSAMSKYLLAGREENPDYEISAVQWPTKVGDASFCGYPYQIDRGVPGRGSAISKNNKNVEKSLAALDFLFGDEGSELMCWGVEGKTFTKTEDGNHYTDFILKNPDGKTPIDAMAKYGIPQYSFAMLRSDAFIELNSVYPEQKEAMEIWAQSDTSRILPKLSFTPDEQKQITNIMIDIYTYTNELTNKLIMGVEPISEWDSAVKKVKNMGIDKVLDIYNTAYKRYINTR